MEKKPLIVFLIFSFVVFLWFFIIGQGGQSALYGNINLIDEGQFAAWVLHMIHGKVIYEDVFVQYGPLMVYPAYLLIKIFGTSFFYIRLWSIIGSFLGYMIAMVTLKRLNVGKIIFIIVAITLLFVPGVQIRQWIGIGVLLFLLAAYNRRSTFNCFLSGVMLSISFFQSIEIGLFSFIVVSVYLLTRFIKQKELQYEIKMGIFFFGSFAIMTAFFLLIFARQGWLSGYVSITQEFSSSIAGMGLPNGQGLPRLFQKTADNSSLIKIARVLVSKSTMFYWSLVLLLIFLAILFIRLTFKSRTNSDVLAFLISIFSLLIYVSIIGRSGHYATIFPFILVLAAYCLVIIKKINPTNKSLKSKLYWLSVVFFCGYALRHISIYRYMLIPDFSRKDTVTNSRTYPLTLTRKDGDNILLLNIFLDQHLSQNKPIYILNNVPGLYFLLNRQNATRYDLPLLAGTIEKRSEIVNQLSISRPQFIIEDFSAWDVDGIKDKERMPEVFAYVKFNYIPFKKIGPYVIYKLK